MWLTYTLIPMFPIWDLNISQKAILKLKIHVWHVAEFGYIENKWHATFGNNLGSESVTVSFHQLNGLFLARERSIPNGSFSSLYCCN